jgi:AraC-like DNA-binding protein
MTDRAVCEKRARVDGSVQRELQNPPSRGTFSTQTIPVKDRLPLWGESILRMSGGLCSRASEDQSFNARITWDRASYVELRKIEASQHSVVLAAQRAGRAPQAFLKVVAQLRGTTRFEQCGRCVWLCPGDWSVYDTTLAYSIDTPESAEQLVLLIPKEHLPERLTLDQLTARRLSSVEGIARLTWNAMLATYEERPSMTAATAEGAADVVTQLVLLSLLELRGTSSTLSLREALRDRIKAYVDRNLHDSHLSVDSVARALSCSRRHLYNAFSNEHEGIAGYVLARRLDAARRAFEDPRHKDQSITAIAFNAGFKSSAHFCRAFTTRFGCSPREWRHRFAEHQTNA